MKELVEAKLQQSTEQLAIWRQRLAQAQQEAAVAAEQCRRWDAAAQVCRELLAVDVPVVLAEDAPVVLAEDAPEDRLAKAERKLAEAESELRQLGVDPHWSLGQMKAYMVEKHLAGV